MSGDPDTRPGHAAMKRISSRDNPGFKRLKALAHSGRERRKENRTLLDGTHLVAGYLERGDYFLRTNEDGAATVGIGDSYKQLVEQYGETTARHFIEAGVKTDLYAVGNEIDFGICGEFEGDWAKRVSIDWCRANLWPRMMPIMPQAR